MNSSPFTAHYNPDTQQVRLTCTLGLLTCTSTIPLADYQQRRVDWPTLYPQAVIIQKS
ncbi:MAG: hypothetical protein ACRYFX_18805 [Janthinobacterium lividum]